MGWIVLVLLAGLWASILLPGALRPRWRTSPQASISAFERTMSVIAPRPPAEHGPGRHVLVLAHPHSLTGRSKRARLLARRRAALARLAGLCVVAAALALSFGGLLTWLFAAVAVVLVGYVAVLRQQRSRRAEARRKVRALRRAPRRARPAPARRRGA